METQNAASKLVTLKHTCPKHGSEECQPNFLNGKVIIPKKHSCRDRSGLRYQEYWEE